VLPLPPPLLQERALGENLRRRYMDTVQSVLMVTGHSRLCDNNGTLRCAQLARSSWQQASRLVGQPSWLGFRCVHNSVCTCLLCVVTRPSHQCKHDCPGRLPACLPAWPPLQAAD
jgi:hypothetical protein